MATVLIIDDESRLRGLLRVVLSQAGHTIIEAGTGADGVAAFEAHRPDLVLTDVSMPGMDGIAVLERIKAIDPRAPVVVMTGEGNTDLAIRAMARGASEYLVKPFDPARTAATVRAILDAAAAKPAPSGVIPRPGESGLIGRSEAVYEVSKLIGRVAGQTSTVLIHGESGTGKELVARAIHAHGPRRNGPFVAVNCAAIPDSLLESELFGHEKGAFTGADRRRIGKFELAGDGTLFLDEIGDMSPVTQAKLLRVLQDQEFHRLGGQDVVRTNARVVAATHRDLRAAAAAGKFREDLFYRLGVVVIHLPPLRDRKEDIPLLVEHFIRRSARNLGLGVSGIAPDALGALREYHWPGNIRELGNVVEQAVLQAHGPTLVAGQFAGLVPRPAAGPPAAARADSGLFDPAAVREAVVARIAAGEQNILPAMLGEYEEVVVTAAIDHCQGNLSRAAKHLGVHRVTLRGKIPALRDKVGHADEGT
jgi:DNA-binding NtrC family response regulator